MSDFDGRLSAIWKQNLPEIHARLDALSSAAETLADTRTLDDEQREEATSAAHKLAGSLGMFGHMEATAVARAIEIDLEAPGLPQPERLEGHVSKLKALLRDALSA